MVRASCVAAWISLCALAHAARYDPSVLTTVVGPPEVVGGPECCKYDSPFMALLNGAGNTVGYTANDVTYVWSLGPTVDYPLQTPLATGLAPDTADPRSLSHCGKWLNSAWMSDDGVVHGYFHQEWNCDYAHGGYTNKSIAYAQSFDHGMTFAPAPQPSPADEYANLIVSGQNFSTVHQTGEGDHGVTRVGDWLYLYFIEWNGPADIHGGTTAGVARSSVKDAGRPGTWWKYHNGSWASPGVGGPSDFIDIAGSAIYNVPAVSMLISVGVIFSSPLAVKWSADGLAWADAAAGPMFTANWSTWDRTPASGELFAYPGLTGLRGTNDGLPVTDALVYFTYLDPGTDFARRWLVRRPLQILAGASGTPPALAALSLWRARGGVVWATTGPVSPASNYTIASPSIALMATSAPAPFASTMAAVRECLLPGAAHAVALVLDGECGLGALTGGSVTRTSGWVATSAASPALLHWASVHVPDTATTLGSAPGRLWRCVGGPGNYSAAFGDSCSSAGAGFVADKMLGYAWGPLAPPSHA